MEHFSLCSPSRYSRSDSVLSKRLICCYIMYSVISWYHDVFASRFTTQIKFDTSCPSIFGFIDAAWVELLFLWNGVATNRRSMLSKWQARADHGVSECRKIEMILSFPNRQSIPHENLSSCYLHQPSSPLAPSFERYLPSAPWDTS